MIKNFLNPEGHHNPISGSKVTAILLKGWILPIGGALAVEGLQSMGLPRLVSLVSNKNRQDDIIVSILTQKASGWLVLYASA